MNSFTKILSFHAAVLVLSVILMVANAEAAGGEFTLKLETSSFTNGTDTMSGGTSNRIEISYAPNGKGYFFVSKESIRMQIIYPDFYYDITGVGVGNKFKITKDIRVFTQIAYYDIQNSAGERVEGYSETREYYLKDRFVGATGYDPGSFDATGVVNDKNAIGGTIGLEFDYELSKNYTLVTIFSWRFFKFGQSIRGYREEWDAYGTGARWQADEVVDISSFNLGLGVRF